MQSNSLSVLFIIILGVASLCALCFIFYRFWFLRKPKRDIPLGDVVVSPASGKIVRILEFGSRMDELDVRKGLLGKVRLLVKDVAKEGFMVVIMMTPFDVHYQRSPVKGMIESVIYRKGSFLNAVKDASSLQALENEKNEVTISNRRLGKLKVVQVAGFLARRITCFVRPKQKIHKGEELGLISLGSQVLLVIPKLKLEVVEGQKVVDGKTIIAKF